MQNETQTRKQEPEISNAELYEIIQKLTEKVQELTLTVEILEGRIEDIEIRNDNTLYC